MNCDESEHARVSVPSDAAATRAARCTDRHDGDGEEVVDDECAPYNIYQHSHNAYLLLLQ